MNTTNPVWGPEIKKRRIFLIVNPAAGTKRKSGISDQVMQLFREDSEINIFHTLYPGHAHEIAKNAAGGNADIVIVAGGDGTINETGRALLHTGVKLGIVPAGSGNGLARHLRIPMNTGKALQAIRNMKSVSIDAGTVNGHPFFCTAGIGFDAYIGREFMTGKSKGLYGYASHVIREYFRYKPSEYVVNLDGNENKQEAFIITVANAGQWGNNAYIAPEADIADGYLDFCLVKKFPKLKGIGMSLKLFNKSIKNSPYYFVKKTKSLRISVSGDTCYHLDGEVFDVKSDLEIGILPACLDVIVP